MTTAITIKSADWQHDKTALQAVRRTVFIEEQQVDEQLEWDGMDEQAQHWLAVDPGGKAIGTLRMLDNGHIGRMAVLADYRRQGIGHALLTAAIKQARQQQLFEVFLYAQTQAQPFYQRNGFLAEGAEFLDANIPHITMRKRLAERRLVGSHGGKFAIDDLATTALELVQQTRRSLNMFFYQFNSETLNKPELLEALSQLARLGRHSEIRLLVADHNQLLQQGRALLQLQQRLSSSFKLRKLSNNDNYTIAENFIVADNIAVIGQSITEPELIWGNFYNQPIAEDYNQQFNELWQHATEDPNLRQLSL